MSEQDNQAERTIPVKTILESLLLVADGPVAVTRLAAALDRTAGEVEEGLHELDADYRDRGLRLQRNKDSVQLVTAPETSPYIQRFLGQDNSGKLSPAALETLSIIAYRQPITRPQIEAIRGVNSDGVIRTLLSHELIEEIGRLEAAGRPILYGTTFQFLQQFGLHALDELPPLDGDKE